MDNKRVKKENTSHVEVLLSSVRTERPGNYLFNIESFSMLLESLTKTNSDNCDSSHFDAGGYKWKLTVYPNGNKKRGGDSYISLYLALADPKSLPQGEEVHMFFKLFVFDYHHDNYLVLEDGKDRRFHVLKSEWGFAKLLPHEMFKDPSQGYLVDDQCLFRVEIFFHKSQISKEGSSLSIKNNVGPREMTFTWKIDKFSTLPGTHNSDVFTIGGLKWTLLLYPEGNTLVKGKCLSLYLILKDISSFTFGWKFYAEFTLRILDQVNRKHHEKAVSNGWFNANPNTSRGHSDFILLSDLKNKSRGFIVNDSVVIQVTFSGVFLNNI